MHQRGRVMGTSRVLLYAPEEDGFRFHALLHNRTISKYGICGAEGQNRTVDTSLFRAVLYQLSYLGISVGCMEGVSVYRITEEKSTLDVRRGGEGGI